MFVTKTHTFGLENKFIDKTTCFVTRKTLTQLNSHLKKLLKKNENSVEVSKLLERDSELNQTLLAVLRLEVHNVGIWNYKNNDLLNDLANREYSLYMKTLERSLKAYVIRMNEMNSLKNKLNEINKLIDKTRLCVFYDDKLIDVKSANLNGFCIQLNV